ncbi:MAG: endopeptidase La [Bacilli bacterium]|nr:endopeptidase La [Bacilli bacterium]
MTVSSTLPVLLIKEFVLLPNQEVKLELNNSLSYSVMELSRIQYHNQLVLVCPKDTLEELPTIDDLPEIAVIARVEKRIALEDGRERITLVGEERVKIKKFYNYKKSKDILLCDYTSPVLPKIVSTKEMALKKELIRLLKQYVKTSPNLDNSILQILSLKTSLYEMTDSIAVYLPMTIEKKLSYVSELNAYKRGEALLDDFVIELQVLKLDQTVNERLQQAMEEEQKEYVVKEKIRLLQEEIGEDDEQRKETLKYQSLLSELELPYKTKKKIESEIQKFSYMSDNSPDLSFERTYLDTFFSLPWNEERIEATDLNYVESILNKSHYGLKEIKERILEYAAMKSRNPLLASPILCLVGPPGTGKSTIAASIAKSLNRDFAKISVGGLNDSSELIGHRKTYLGSAPGKIIQALQKCGSKNPVLLIDEVDKMVKDYKGDPASILLDVLDPNLNQSYTDNYLEEPFDLSHVLFLLTANYIQDIPPELKDRLEVIEISSYTTLEKIALAKDYLLPSIYLEYHLENENIKFSDEALEYIILNYTYEAGVRDLRRKLETILRKMMLESVKKKKGITIKIEEKDVKKYLQETITFQDMKPKFISPGLVNGLAVTSIGGEVLPIESTFFTGNGKVLMTGMLGDVMKESLDVVMSFIKSHSKDFGIEEKLFVKKDVHIHMLQGSIPKNGPSAGAAITTSLISLYKNQTIPCDIAMTGEMSLRGELIAVGGIKEKVIASMNAGIKTLFLPKANEIDVKKLPKELKKAIDIVYIQEYQEIYKMIFKD